jgi:two-component system CheB/CheR fusion protein
VVDSTASDHQLEALLEYMKEQRGFDFTGYKRASLSRRFRVRMAALGLETFADYQDLLAADPPEFDRLFDTLLINLTSFFRDPAEWKFLAERVLPPLLAAKAPDARVRVWSAGCATGEEPYSVAMLFAEALGLEACCQRVKIYGTDRDEAALMKNRAATYSAREVAGVSPELLARYFTPQDGQYQFHRELRRTVVFGRHDVIHDIPISRIDLLLCRNVMIYFNSDVQAAVMGQFYRALNPSGYLFLGKAETLLSHKNSFLPMDAKHRIFQKGTEPPVARWRPAAPPAAAVDLFLGEHAMQEIIFEASPVAQVIVDQAGTLAFANANARRLFHLDGHEIGRPLQDLDLSYRPVDLRQALDEAYARGEEVRMPPVEWSLGGTSAVSLAVRIIPLYRDRTPIGASVAFEDVTLAQQITHELEKTREEKQTVQEELQSANEELETTNEELQSTVEEMETTNEELQSSNEEMETMNEELESTNEELRTVNEELRTRGDQLDHANQFLAGILASMKSGVAVLNRDLRVRVWSRRAEDLWGLREDEVLDQRFVHLDIGLPVAALVQPLHDCLRGKTQTLTLDATNRRGRPIRCHVTCTPLHLPGSDTEGAVVLMDEGE